MNRHILRPYLQPEPDLVALAQSTKISDKKDPSVNPPLKSPVVSTNVQSNADFWSISLLYRGEQYTADLMKTLLEDGRVHTQDEWAARYERVRGSDEFYTPDYPAFYGIVKSAKIAGLEDVRTFLKDTSRAKWLMTLTRIAYQPSSHDTVIHNYGTQDRYQTSVDFITLNEFIINTNKPWSYQGLLETRDNVQEINEVFNWLNGTNTYAWKLNSKPDKVIERVARFGAGSDWAGLYCDGNPTGSDSSLGVRLRKKI